MRSMNSPHSVLNSSSAETSMSILLLMFHGT